MNLALALSGVIGVQLVALAVAAVWNGHGDQAALYMLGLILIVRVWAWPNTTRTWRYSRKHRDGYRVAVVLGSVRRQADELAARMYEHRTQWLEGTT